jgi:hypothetical protein
MKNPGIDAESGAVRKGHIDEYFIRDLYEIIIIIRAYPAAMATK